MAIEDDKLAELKLAVDEYVEEYIENGGKNNKTEMMYIFEAAVGLWYDWRDINKASKMSLTIEKIRDNLRKSGLMYVR